MESLTLARPADLQIPKLTVGNFKIWRELIVTALRSRGHNPGAF
jgi:hypothetical protein